MCIPGRFFVGGAVDRRRACTNVPIILKTFSIKDNLKGHWCRLLCFHIIVLFCYQDVKVWFFTGFFQIFILWFLPHHEN